MHARRASPTRCKSTTSQGRRCKLHTRPNEIVCSVHAKPDRRRNVHVSRPPVQHWTSWEEDLPDCTPEQRFRLARIAPSTFLHDYDIVANQAEVGNRNEGKYIYKDRALYHLATEPDDYGNLPEWVDVRKDDCGYSYFAEDEAGSRMIDHRTWIPFRTGEWEVGESTLQSSIHPFKFAYVLAHTLTRIVRRADRATATIAWPVMLSAPWLGGPVSDVREGQAGRGWNSYEYDDGTDLTIRHDRRDEFGNYTLTEPLQSTSDVVHVPVHIVEIALTRAAQYIRHLFDTEKVMYLEASGPCQFTLDELKTLVVPIPVPSAA